MNHELRTHKSKKRYVSISSLLSNNCTSSSSSSSDSETEPNKSSPTKSKKETVDEGYPFFHAKLDKLSLQAQAGCLPPSNKVYRNQRFWFQNTANQYKSDQTRKFYRNNSYVIVTGSEQMQVSDHIMVVTTRLIRDRIMPFIIHHKIINHHRIINTTTLATKPNYPPQQQQSLNPHYPRRERSYYSNTIKYSKIKVHIIILNFGTKFGNLHKNFRVRTDGQTGIILAVSQIQIKGKTHKKTTNVHG